MIFRILQLSRRGLGSVRLYALTSGENGYDGKGSFKLAANYFNVLTRLGGLYEALNQWGDAIRFTNISKSFDLLHRTICGVPIHLDAMNVPALFYILFVVLFC